MGFSRQEYWSGLPFPSPGDLPDPGIKPRSPASQVDALPFEPPGKPSRGVWNSLHTPLAAQDFLCCSCWISSLLEQSRAGKVTHKSTLHHLISDLIEDNTFYLKVVVLISGIREEPLRTPNQQLSLTFFSFRSFCFAQPKLSIQNSVLGFLVMLVGLAGAQLWLACSF